MSVRRRFLLALLAVGLGVLAATVALSLLNATIH
jgi:predicted exporter